MFFVNACVQYNYYAIIITFKKVKKNKINKKNRIILLNKFCLFL